MTTLHAFAIAAADLDRIRAAGLDDLGNPFRTFPADGDGEPLRCCLRNARAGESIALISYSPHHRPSVWAEAGPVYVHGESCAGHEPDAGLPGELRTGPRVLRSYRADGSLNYDAIAVVPDGEDVGPALEKLLGRDDVAEVHTRAYATQCFLYAVRAR